MKPFLRWAGGKAWAGDQLIAFARDANGNEPAPYCEPFLGGGALFVCMLSEGLIAKNHCYLGDLAPEAFLVWKGVLYNPVRTAMRAARWMQSVKDWPHGPEKGYYHLREEWNERTDRNPNQIGDALSETAGLLIAINRLSFKGLLRVNPDGNFNVPYGHLPNPTLDVPGIIKVGQAMQAVNASLICDGWDKVFEWCKDDFGGIDVVDPPYAGTTHTAYTVRGWNDLDRKSLAAACRRRSNSWSTFATDARLPDAWDAWSWGNPQPFDRPGGMGDGGGSGRNERGEIIVRAPRRTN